MRIEKGKRNKFTILDSDNSKMLSSFFEHLTYFIKKHPLSGIVYIRDH